MPQTILTKSRLIQEFKTLGIASGDLLMVHSALSSLGKVEGGAVTVIEALRETLGPSGTLMMPVFAGPAPFDIKNTPSGLGALTEAFRTYPGVVRSFHPTHSVAVLGPKAQELVKDHLDSPTAAGRNTPYGRLIALHGKILLLGVDNDRNTTMHTLEEYIEAPYLSDREFTYLDAHGVQQVHGLRLFPGPHRDFIGVSPLLRQAGAETVGKVGQATARLLDAQKMHDVVMAAFKTDPALVLCDNPNCGDCVMQRRKIRVHRLKSESFTLSALASSVSAYPDEIASELQRAGVYDLVIDRLYGRPIWTVPENLLRRAAQVFNEENISVSALHASPNPAKLDQAAAQAAIFSVDQLILPIALNPAGYLDWAGRKNMTVIFENQGLDSTICDELLKEAKPGAAFAFNPAGFALLGEKPFLEVIKKRAIKKATRLLLLTDATFGGTYTLPGRGNGEVKELLSIFRSQGFDGRIVLAAGPGGPSFREMVESFWNLMETM